MRIAVSPQTVRVVVYEALIIEDGAADDEVQAEFEACMVSFEAPDMTWASERRRVVLMPASDVLGFFNRETERWSSRGSGEPLTACGNIQALEVLVL